MSLTPARVWESLAEGKMGESVSNNNYHEILHTITVRAIDLARCWLILPVISPVSLTSALTYTIVPILQMSKLRLGLKFDIQLFLRQWSLAMRP